MKVVAFFLLAASACACAGDVPPLPYTTASASQSNSAATSDADRIRDRVQTLVNPYAADHFGTEGFNVQSGYEGYLIPAGDHGVFPLVDGLDFKTHHGVLSKFFGNLISLGSKVAPKIALGAAAFLALFLIGGCVNALVCSFTPFCTVSFAGLGVTKDTMRSYLTPDRISSTATFVMDAIKKYKDMYETISNDIETGKKMKKK